MRMQDYTISTRAVIDNINLRYSSSLLHLDWVGVVDKALPLLSNVKKNTIRHVCGKFSINPILVLGKVIQDQMQDSRFSMQSDDEFRVSISSFANQLSRSDQRFDVRGSNMGESPLELSLLTVLGNDEDLLQDYLSICYTISRKYNIPKTIQVTENQHDVLKRNDDEHIDLDR